MTTTNDLNTRFGIDGKLSFTLMGDDMIMADITTDLCTARIAMQGAQVLDWTPAGQKPVIWLSADSHFVSGKSIRGGTPVCWPWFGAHESQSDFPAHGYARTVDWSMTASEETEDKRIRLNFALIEDASTQKLWPHNSPLEIHMLLGSTLELELVTCNESSQAISITEAIHTYFAASDVRQVKVSGLENGEYLDKVDAFAHKTQKGDITFSGEVDRVYLATETECVIHDAGWNRRIHINKTGSRSTVVWNPWVEKALAMGDMGEQGYLSMLCVESANAASDIVTIAPGESHILRVEYRVE